MNHFVVDAETDGLYGEVIAIGAIVFDENGTQIDCFAGKIQGLIPENITDEWTRLNVT